MKYHKCLNCNFNITENDDYCQNCGLYSPLESITQIKRKEDIDDEKIVQTIMTVVAIIVFIPCIFYFGSEAGSNGIICCAIPVGIILFLVISFASAFFSPFVIGIYYWIANIFIDKKNDLIAERKAPNPESFKFKEVLINKRKTELTERELQIKEVLEKARLNKDDRWKQICILLEDTLKTLNQQKGKYDLKAIEINIVRLQNEIAPLIYETEELSHNLIAHNLKALEKAKSKSINLAGEVDNKSKLLGKSIEIKELNSKLYDIQQSINKLSDLFLGRQAVLALKDINPLDESLNPVLPPIKAIKELEIFNTQVAITEFYSTFDELESEYKRIQVEENVAAQVDKIINETYKAL